MQGQFQNASTAMPRTLIRGFVTLLVAVGFLGLDLGLRPGVALANRFGPPWQAQVTAEQTVVYSQPDASSPVVGPLPRTAIVVVTGEVNGADGAQWTRITDGYIRSSDLVEYLEPWVAEVAVPSASVYAKPIESGEIRRTAASGALLRVTGVSPGLEGDTSTWWATTEGYVKLGTLRGATGDWARQWTLPGAEEAAAGWWGRVRGAANVRVAATTDAPVVGGFAGGERIKVLAEEDGLVVGGSPKWYRIDGGRYANGRIHSSLVERLPDPAPSTQAQDGVTGTWINVSKSANTLTLVRDGQAVFTTFVALGKAGRETPNGRHGTFGKYRADDMTSTSVADAESPYDLPNVPFVQYYLDGGFAIHGTYWHDRFGSQESQGCVNVTYTDGAFLFGQTLPSVPDGDTIKWIPKEQATPVFIVD